MPHAEPPTHSRPGHGTRRPRIGVLTTGGDCPGLNAAIARLCADAPRLGVDLVGIRDGFAGLSSPRPTRATAPLPRWEDPSLSRRGGTILGSIRMSLGASDRLEAALQGIERLELSGLVVFGGNGGMVSARQLAQAGVSVAGIPKTIDNDVAGTERAIGYATAVDRAVSLLDSLDDTADSHGTRFLVELMGRRSGALAAASAEAAAVDGVLLPEACATLDDVIDRLREGRRSRVVVAEGAWLPELGDVPRNRNGKAKVGGVVPLIEEALDGKVKNLRTVVFGHLLRGGTPNAADRLLAQHSASIALERLADLERATFVRMRDGRVESVPLDEEVTATRQLTADEVTRMGRRLLGSPTR